MGNQQNKASSEDRSLKRIEKDVKTANKHAGAGKEKPHEPGEGIRSMKTSGVFRALNFELYTRPSKPIMIAGVVAFTLCVSYMTYMRYNYNKQQLYESLAEDGTTIVLRPRKSRWDS